MVPFQPEENRMGRVPDEHRWLRRQSLAGAATLRSGACGCGHRSGAAAAGTPSRWFCTPQRAGGCWEMVCSCLGSCRAHPAAAGTRCAGHPQMSAFLPVTSSDSLVVLLGNTKKWGLCQKLCSMNSAMKIRMCTKR